MTLDANLFAAVDDLDQNPFEQQADDGLALLAVVAARQSAGRSCARSRIAASSAGLRPAGCSRLNALVLGLETRLFGQGLLPLPLERARHQPVLGLDGIVLPARPLGLVAGALEPLPPMPIERRSFGLADRRRAPGSPRSPPAPAPASTSRVTRASSGAAFSDLTERLAVVTLSCAMQT